MRSLPLLLALRRMMPEEPEPSASRTSGGELPLVGSSAVAALLVTSVLPEVSRFGAVLARHAVALITLAVALRYGYLGLTVLAGVRAYRSVSMATVAGE